MLHHAVSDPTVLDGQGLASAKINPPLIGPRQLSVCLPCWVTAAEHSFTSELV